MYREAFSMPKPKISTEIQYKELDKALAKARGDRELFTAIVNSPFEQFKVQLSFLALGIIVLLLVNEDTGCIERIALSDTDLAKRTTEVSYVPFKKIKIPIGEPDNIIAKAIRTGQPQDTVDWKFLFKPAMTPAQARINQANAGIAYSAVYPLSARDGGALIFSYFQYRDLIGDVQRDFMTKYRGFVEKRLGRS
jgi:hypothetical protein